MNERSGDGRVEALIGKDGTLEHVLGCRPDLPANIHTVATLVERARADGFPVDRAPREGDVAVLAASDADRAAYVEEVQPDGTIIVSEAKAHSPQEITLRPLNPGGFEFIHRKAT